MSALTNRYLALPETFATASGLAAYVTLSRFSTSCSPSPTSRRTTAEPMKPKPPVTMTRMSGTSFELGETLRCTILVRQIRRGGLNRPRDIQLGVGPED